MVVGNQRKGGRDIKSLADSHQRSRHQQSFVGRYMPGRPGHQRPGQQAPANSHPPPEAVCDVSSNRAQKGINPFELTEHPAPIRIIPDVKDVAHHRSLHRGEHLPIEIVE